MYTHKSGAQKRKERASREQKISTFINMQAQVLRPESDKNLLLNQLEKSENSSLRQLVKDDTEHKPRNTTQSSELTDCENIKFDNYGNVDDHGNVDDDTSTTSTGPK